MFLDFLRKNFATLIGYMALLLWSTSALAATKICHLPIFQVLTTTFLVAFVIVTIRLTLTKRWSLVLSQPWYVWVVGVLGICAQQIAYIMAFKNGPALQVDIIILLWPILMVAFSWLLLKDRLKPRHFVSCLLGFSSVILLNCTDQGFLLFSSWYSGYTYAAICAVLWSCYIVFTRHFSTIPSEMIGMYYGVGGIFTLIAHMSFEDFIVPAPGEWFILLYMGMMVAGAAYICWDFGVKKGNVKLLATLSYGNSIVSLAWLVIFADVALQGNLVGAGGLVFLGGILATESFSEKAREFVAWLRQSSKVWMPNTVFFLKYLVDSEDYKQSVPTFVPVRRKSTKR